MEGYYPLSIEFKEGETKKYNLSSKRCKILKGEVCVHELEGKVIHVDCWEIGEKRINGHWKKHICDKTKKLCLFYSQQIPQL